MTRQRRIKAWLMASACLAIGMAAQPALAADAAASASAADGGAATVESITVTARRKPETLFNVAAPVTVVSGETLKAFDISDIITVMNLVPNAVVPTNPDNYVTYINIRGIQQVDAQAQPNFGIYRNGMYAGGERPNYGPLFDVDRIEVNSGPQSGLYGRDAVGGAINVIYATPSSKFGGYLTAGYGNWDRTEIQGAVNLPVSSAFAVRLAGWYENQAKGELYNTYLNTYVDKNREEGLRLTAKWQPTKDLSVLWMAEYANNTGPSIQTYAPNGIGALITVSAPETPTSISRNTPNVNHNHQVYLSQDVKYASSIGVFELLSSYSDYHLSDVEDGDQTSVDPAGGFLNTSLELRRHESVRNIYSELLWHSPPLGPVDIISGVSYFDQVFKFERQYTSYVDLNYLSGAGGNTACAILLSDPTCPGVPGGAFPALGVQSAIFEVPGGGTQVDTQSISAFIDGTVHLTKQWSLNATVRYTNDAEHLNFRQFATATGPGSPYIAALLANIFPALSLVDKPSFHNVSPSVEINYRPTSELNFYALYSTGFRAGGFNTVTTTASLIPYGSEQAQNYEVGAKTLWLNGRLGLNLAAFYMAQNHLLTYEPDPIAPPQFGFFYLANVGSAGTYGVEFTGVAQPTSWLSTSVTVGWLDGHYTGGVSYGVSQAGQPFQNTRTWTVNAEAQVRYPLTEGFALISGINYHVETGGVLDIPTLPWPTLNRLDATFGVAHNGLSVVVYVNNAFNSRPPDFVYGNGGTTLVQGATYGVRATAKF